MCGVIGVIGQSPVIGEIADGLLFIQHRGQDAAGAATFDGKTFRSTKGMGLVREVFDREDLSRFVGHMRFSFGPPMPVLEEAMDRLRAMVTDAK